MIESAERLAFRADQVEQDRFSQARCANFIGNIVTHPEIQVEPVEDPHYENLFEAVRGAADNDGVGRANTRANAHVATVEAIYKAGHITVIKSHFRSDGRVVQHGQTMMETYRNGLIFTADSSQMRRRLSAEALNGHRIEDLKRSGLLNDYCLFVPSLFPDDMTEAEAAKKGFFVDTKTAALQITTADGDTCVTESAFVAGVTEPSGSRHDIKAAKLLYQSYGYDTSGWTVTDFLENPLLIHKSLLPNGVVDIVKLFDDYSGGLFFGQNIPRQSYIDFVVECQNREARLWDTVEDVTNDLVASAKTLRDPLDAIERLYQIVKRKVIKQAVKDPSIDARVFGLDAFYHIEQARYFMQQGQTEMANQSIRSAANVARVSMCGMGAEQLQTQLADENANHDTTTVRHTHEKKLKEDRFGPLEFQCQNKHWNKRRRGELIPNCRVCGVSVSCKPDEAKKKAA